MKLKLKLKLRKSEERPETTGTQKFDQVSEVYHKLELNELAAKFNTSLRQGLDETEASNRLTKLGPNRIKQSKEKKWKKVFWYFFGGFGGLFSAAAVLCILSWEPLGSLGGQTPQLINLALGIMLILVVLIQGGFNAFQDWSSQRVMNSIRNMMPSNAYVIRNGKEVF